MFPLSVLKFYNFFQKPFQLRYVGRLCCKFWHLCAQAKLVISWLIDRAVYEQLGKYGDIDNQILCRERVEELEPSIRYCLHKVGESSLQTSELLDLGKMEGPAFDQFQAKLEVHFMQL